MSNELNSGMPQNITQKRISQNWNKLTPAEQDSIRKSTAQIEEYFKKHKNDKNIDKVSLEDIIKNENNKVEEKRTTLPDGRTQITQFKNGKETGRIYYDSVGNLMGSERYEYDKKGNVKKETYNRSDGTIQQVNEYKNGVMVRVTEYNEGGNVERRTEYDNGGMFSKPKITVYRGDGTKETEIIQDGEDSKEIHYAEDGKTVIFEE